MTRNLRVAFVGMRRQPSDMPPGYWETFVRYHLELPFYLSAHAPIDVVLTTVEPVECNMTGFPSGGSLTCMTEGAYQDRTDLGQFDVIVHWRKWFPDLYDHLARNVILSQDHSYGPEWKSAVKGAFESGCLDGILVFPTWHRENTARELNGIVPKSRLYGGMTLGVDTDTYFPNVKDPRHLLWASDPGRGLEALINPFLKLWSKDHLYRLTVTYPDYVRPETVARYASFLRHPGVRHMPGVRNGPQLWDLFNSAGVLPYSSTFPEPSSRCHRQAMAAGCLVLYPPSMGSPSELIESGLTGLVAPVGEWADLIHEMIVTGRRDELGANARTFALSENWAVQARRFHDFFSEDI